VADRSQIEDER
jgi:hypothetical protein